MSETDSGRPVAIVLPSDPTGKAWMHLAADLLDMAGQEFAYRRWPPSSHTCNDYTLPAWMTREDRRALSVAFHEFNGDPQEKPSDSRQAFDFCLMGLCAAALRYAAGPVPALSPKRQKEHAKEQRALALVHARLAVHRTRDASEAALKARQEAEAALEALLKEPGA